MQPIDFYLVCAIFNEISIMMFNKKFLGMKKIFWCYVRAVLALLFVFCISGCMFWLAFQLQFAYDIFSAADTVTFGLMFFAVLAHAMAMFQFDYLFPVIEPKYLGKAVVHIAQCIFVVLGAAAFALFFKQTLVFLIADFELLRLFSIVFGTLMFISFVYHVYGDADD